MSGSANFRAKMAQECIRTASTASKPFWSAARNWTNYASTWCPSVAVLPWPTWWQSPSIHQVVRSRVSVRHQIRNPTKSTVGSIPLLIGEPTSFFLFFLNIFQDCMQPFGHEMLSWKLAACYGCVNLNNNIVNLQNCLSLMYSWLICKWQTRVVHGSLFLESWPDPTQPDPTRPAGPSDPWTTLWQTHGHKTSERFVIRYVQSVDSTTCFVSKAGQIMWTDFVTFVILWSFVIFANINASKPGH